MLRLKMGNARLEDRAPLKRGKWGGELLINIMVGTQNGGFGPPRPPLDHRLYQTMIHEQVSPYLSDM